MTEGLKAAQPAPRGAALPRGDRAGRRTWILLSAPLLVVAVGVAAPVVMIIWVSFWKADGGAVTPAFDTSTWSAILESGAFRSAAFQTVKITIIVLAIVAVLGTLSGYYLARFVRSPRTQTVLLLLAILPFWTSYVIRIITWQPLYGSKGGLNWVLREVGITSQPVTAFLYNQTAMVVAMASLYVVFVIGPVFWALNRVDPEITSAARSLGASPWKAFWTVELPLAKGGLVAGLFFATIFLLGDYSTEQLIGGGTNPALSGATNAIAGSGQWPTAAALACILLVIAAVFLTALMKIHDLRRVL
jgi:putative spermidine/putrescine transport system permease protein